MALFNPSRDEVRQFFFDVWAKYQAHQPLSGLEAIALQVIEMHPEYHALLASPERHLEREYLPEMGETNPFLHMSLHLSIHEQISINQPTGITTHYQALCNAHQDAHIAQHEIMDCLAETIWQAQRSQLAPDSLAYLACIQNKLNT